MGGLSPALHLPSARRGRSELNCPRPPPRPLKAGAPPPLILRDVGAPSPGRCQTGHTRPPKEGPRCETSLHCACMYAAACFTVLGSLISCTWLQTTQRISEPYYPRRRTVIVCTARGRSITSTPLQQPTVAHFKAVIQNLRGQLPLQAERLHWSLQFNPC